jgi:hypothetical protein
MASKFRHRYLRNFYELNAANLRLDPTVPKAFVILAGQPKEQAIARLIDILRWQGVEVRELTEELWVKHSPTEEFHEIPLGSFLIYTDQPQKRNVLSLFEKQVYPNRINANGQPDPPYDVAGWTLPLQMGIETFEVWDIKDLEKMSGTIKPVTNSPQARARLNLSAAEPFAKAPNPLKTNPRIGLYKGSAPSMDEGWTRLVFDNFQIPYTSVSDRDIRDGGLLYDAIILPADGENAIVTGLNANRYPEDFAGGIGEEGVEKLKEFVRNGGKLICFDDSCGMVIKRFGLAMKNVLSGVPRSEFYNPGSIVALEVDSTQTLGRGFTNPTPAYFTNSSAFDIENKDEIRTIAQYAIKDTLLSGWMVGTEKILGKSALAETSYGKGKLILFAFRPQHRGQTWATFPLIFSALEK